MANNDGTPRSRWERDVLAPALRSSRERAPIFATRSGTSVARVYAPDDIAGLDYARDIGDPGEPPYTRGIHATGYRGKPWTMRQFAGFGTPGATNARYRELIAAGGTGLSVAFDLPTLMGRDPDHPLAQGEVGKCGVSVASLADMETLFDGIRLDGVTVSMTINSPAPMVLAMYLALAERQRVPWDALGGTIQNDILKEFIAEKEFIYPPRPSMRLVTDVFAFAAGRLPKWNTISVSGYHIREAGATAVQELAFTLGDGIAYVEHAVRAGLPVDDVAPRISFFFNAHSDFFEEIAKFRAARRMWTRIIRDRFGARDPRSMKLRFHAQTAGVSLTAQQPYNNVVRTALQAVAAIAGGANSLHTNALDEALALPTAEAARLALRTQQVLAGESGLIDVIDPFGGSWFVESLTRDLEAGATAYIDEIDRMGGMVAAIEHGFPQREIADAAYRFQQGLERGDVLIVGVNAQVDAADGGGVPTLALDEAAEVKQRAGIEAVRAGRDRARVARALEALRDAARGTANTMPCLIECARAYATVGEMCDSLRDVWGEHVETPAI